MDTSDAFMDEKNRRIAKPRLKRLVLKNFKSVASAIEIDFVPLTFLIGPNSSGKSSIFDALLILRLFGESPGQAIANLNRWLRKRGDGFYDPYFLCETQLSPRILSFTGTRVLAEHPWFYHLIENGANLGVALELWGQRLQSIKRISITINDETVLTFSDTALEFNGTFEKTRYYQGGPWYEPGKHFVSGVWEMPKSSLLAQELNLESLPDTRLGGLFAQDTGDMYLLHGVMADIGSDGELRIERDDRWNPILRARSFDSLEIQRDIFLQDHGDVLRASEDYLITRSAPRQTWQDLFLGLQKAQPFESRMSREEYMDLLRSEFSVENANGLNALSTRIANALYAFVKSALLMQSVALDCAFVPGSRQAVSSREPIHLSNRSTLEGYPFADDGLVVENRRGVPVRSPEIDRTFYKGHFRFPSSLNPNVVGDLISVLSKYATWHVLNEAPEFNEKRLVALAEGTKDFPNYALNRYLRSMSRYKYGARIFCLEEVPASNELENELGGSFLVFLGVRNESSNFELFEDVGSSLGYLLPVLAAMSQENLCFIEQPELHLHPKLQDELAQALIAAARNDRVMILETHSEIFLLRCAQQVAMTRQSGSLTNVEGFNSELSLDSSMVTCYYFDVDQEGSSVLRRIRFAEDGTLVDDWPNGFFEDNWSSGLNRLKRFSSTIDYNAAVVQWPWIRSEASCIKVVEEWLPIFWASTQDRVSFPVVASIYAGKIVETVLAEMIWDPFWSSRGGSSYSSSRFDRLLSNQRGGGVFQSYPSLGEWIAILNSASSVHASTSDVFVSAVASFIAEQPWYGEFSKMLAEVRPALRKLKQLRDSSAHTGQPEPIEVEKMSHLIARGKRPGIIFAAFGGDFAPTLKPV